MKQHVLPEWAKSLFDARFNEQTGITGKLPEIEPLRLRQVKLESQLKQELAPRLYQLILEWEETLNYRNTLEKEWMYMAGIKDGMVIVKQLQDFISR